MASLFFFFIFVLFALLTAILLAAWWETKNKIYSKLVTYFWLGMFGIFIFGKFISFLSNKKKLDKEDFYGEYIINRDYFPGKQADWQYNNFRFEINENDSLYFYVTDKEQISKTYKGTISTTNPKNYKSARLRINMVQPTIHIIKSDPTIYRTAWNFHLVFNSEKFNNMYFKKGTWKPINE